MWPTTATAAMAMARRQSSPHPPTLWERIGAPRSSIHLGGIFDDHLHHDRERTRRISGSRNAIFFSSENVPRDAAESLLPPRPLVSTRGSRESGKTICCECEGEKERALHDDDGGTEWESNDRDQSGRRRRSSALQSKRTFSFSCIYSTAGGAMAVSCLPTTTSKKGPAAATTPSTRFP